MGIEMYGYYHYRTPSFELKRITIVDIGPYDGFYYYVDGHLTKEEILEKRPHRSLIHKNNINL